jgi:hypothetical protein
MRPKRRQYRDPWAWWLKGLRLPARFFFFEAVPGSMGFGIEDFDATFEFFYFFLLAAGWMAEVYLF